ncbi:MAG: proline--tRNA ligase [Eggerthellaceae bacterium]
MNKNVNPAILRMSSIYAPTLKEDPSDADITSAKLLLRAGMIRKEAGGLYSFLPLGLRVLHKIENIVREEMDASGAQEMLLPFVQPADLWRQSGRWNVYGPELLRVVDRHENEFCLSPTHEEIITDLINNELRSYRDLPKNFYQIQIKFRDEIRPRFGLLRGREFVMKDAYSFNATQESLDETYNDMREAYTNMCDRIGLEYRIVDADPGQIGGNASEEFMALAETGEAELVYCDCGYAADTEAGACTPHPTVYPATEMVKLATPGVHTIADLAAFLGCEQSATVKAFAGKDEEGSIWVLFVPGDYEVNECKAAGLVGGFEPLTDEEMAKAQLAKGSMGPVGLPQGVRIAADESLRDIERWVVGANEDGYHFTGAQQGSDFTVDAWGDLSLVRVGDACPTCGKPLQAARGIEVSQIFKLGTKYSESMDATFMDEQGSEQHFLMGCYGVGISRTMAAVVEQCNDENGMFWPFSIAPAHVCIIPLASPGDAEVYPVAEKLAADFAAAGMEVVIDDRDERAGVKFADADLIGWPLQIVVGKRGLKEGSVEIKRRKTGEKKLVKLATIQEAMAFAHRMAKPAGAFVHHLF